jgi:adenylyl cyclase-associated protein
MSPPPKPLLDSYLDGTLFWSNKVRVLNKKKGDDGAKYVLWCDKLRDMLKELAKYAKTYHTTGVVYNPKGGSNYGSSSSGESASSPSAKVTVGKGGGGGMSDIFKGIKSIDQSSGKTAGLRKVEKSQMTHKNAGLRKTGAIASKPSTRRGPAAPKKPASLKLERSRWICEYQTEKVEIEANTKQEVYIFGCVGATIVVKGKCKALTIDNCTKTAVVIDSVISTVEAVNCKGLKIQVMKFAPAVAIDKTDGYQLYLPKSSLETTMTTSKSSEMNVNFEQADGEWKEIPIPEQFVSKYSGGKLTTEVSDLYS